MSSPNDAIALADGGIGLIVTSPTYGTLLIEVDGADYNLVTDKRWYASWERHSFYARTTVRKGPGQWTSTTLHRLLLPDAVEVDHIDRNGLNNRRANLRPVNAAENQRNRRRQVNNTSGYRGVFFDRGVWRAQIRVDGARSYLGRHATAEAAARAFDAAARQAGYLESSLNFPRS